MPPGEGRRASRSQEQHIMYNAFTWRFFARHLFPPSSILKQIFFIILLHAPRSLSHIANQLMNAKLRWVWRIILGDFYTFTLASSQAKFDSEMEILKNISMLNAAWDIFLLLYAFNIQMRIYFRFSEVQSELYLEYQLQLIF